MSNLDYSAVHHPSHYNQTDRKECWDEWVDKFGADTATIICLGSADKYLYRAGNKNGNSREQDVAKARAFCRKANELVLQYGDSIRTQTYKMLNILDKELEQYD